MNITTNNNTNIANNNLTVIQKAANPGTLHAVGHSISNAVSDKVHPIAAGVASIPSLIVIRKILTIQHTLRALTLAVLWDGVTKQLVTKHVDKAIKNFDFKEDTSEKVKLILKKALIVIFTIAAFFMDIAAIPAAPFLLLQDFYLEAKYIIEHSNKSSTIEENSSDA